MNEYARTLSGMESYCVRAFGEALEIIPSTLAENAGLNPISTVTELRNRHAQGERAAGINVRKVTCKVAEKINTILCRILLSETGLFWKFTMFILCVQT